MKLIRDLIIKTYRNVAELLLCAIGSAIWVLSTRMEDEWSGWIGFAICGVFWTFALDLERTRAKAEGVREGAALTVAAIEACEGLDITITHRSDAA